MKSLCLLIGVVAFSVIMFANAQNLDSMDVETRDILREKRQIIISQLPGIQSHQIGVIGVNARCFWAGTSPFCSGSCGKGYHSVAKDSKGNGKACVTGMKKYCCPLGTTIG